MLTKLKYTIFVVSCHGNQVGATWGVWGACLSGCVWAAQVTTKISQVPIGAKDADDFRQQGPLQGSLNTSGQDKL